MASTKIRAMAGLLSAPSIGGSRTTAPLRAMNSLLFVRPAPPIL